MQSSAIISSTAALVGSKESRSTTSSVLLVAFHQLMQSDLVDIQTHGKSSCSLGAYSNTEGPALQY